MVRTVAAAGVAAELALLATLAGAVGLGPGGWLAGLMVGLGANLLLARGLLLAGARAPGPADLVTLTRATLVGGVAALVAQSTPHVALLVTLAGVALALDAVDGQVARRTATASGLGARFDMEVDAFLILVLSVAVARPLGAWVLAIGFARYAFVAAGWLLPWLREPTPPRYWCKVVAAVQGIVLTVAVADVLPRAWMAAVVAVALALLAESFGRDVWWLTSRHRRAARPRVGRTVVPS